MSYYRIDELGGVDSTEIARRVLERLDRNQAEPAHPDPDDATYGLTPAGEAATDPEDTMPCCDTCPYTPTCEETEDFQRDALRVGDYAGDDNPHEDRCRWCHRYSGDGDFCSEEHELAFEDFWGADD